MKRFAPLPLLLFLASCSTPDPTIVVHLQPMMPSPGTSIRWSPKGEKLPLVPEGNALSATFFLGPRNDGPVKIVLETGPDSQYPNLLTGDWNHNGNIEDDSTITTVPSENRGKIWSSFKAVIDIPVKDPVTGEAAVNPYPLSFWYVYDPLEPDAEKVIRYSRSGWMQGSFESDTLKGTMMLTEMQMDGRYDSLDSWNLAIPGDLKTLYGAGSRSCTDHAWLGDKAFRITYLDPSGRLAKLAPIDTVVSRQEEEAARDYLAADRNAARSGRKVNFSSDYKSALQLAGKQSKPLFIDFQTTWCGPCHQMDQYVYTADTVVNLSAGMLAVKVDGDQQRDLVKKYAVSGYPTMIMLAPDGKEIRRVVGYQTVKQMAEFLGK